MTPIPRRTLTIEFTGLALGCSNEAFEREQQRASSGAEVPSDDGETVCEGGRRVQWTGAGLGKPLLRGSDGSDALLARGLQ